MTAAASSPGKQQWRSELEISSDLAQCQTSLSELNSSTHALRQRLFRERVAPTIPGASAHVSDEAMAIYVLSGCQEALASLFLETRAPELPLGGGTRARLVEDCFLKGNLDHWTDLFDPKTSRQRCLRKKALHFLAEAQVATWIRDQNLQRGVAPSSSMVAQENSRLKSLQQGAQEEGSPRQRTARKFAVLMRRRWHLGFRKLPLRCATFRPEEQLVLARLSVFCLFFCNFLARVCYFCAGTGAEIWYRFSVPFWYLISGTILVLVGDLILNFATGTNFGYRFGSQYLSIFASGS